MRMRNEPQSGNRSVAYSREEGVTGRAATPAVTDCARGRPWIVRSSRSSMTRTHGGIHRLMKEELHDGDDFGDVIPAMFTDEYYIASKRGADCVPWTEALAETIARRRGFAILECLPELYHNVAGQEFSPARYAYRRTLSEVFTENFTKRIADWCERHGITLTGHLLEEEINRMLSSTIKNLERRIK